ncbi:MAG: hypothetical protein E6H05_06670 [Bacillati bacterium ANGP1]|uniref:Uncharacterized protein n=1 Tax=Candidatus Segetimicrobium genomatis TaxID=2569760 RepID=A0A537IW60_9BACT|nr:MAG: hypothetical protein E6H05_06670 [Terrabacteria group bacterium ANGP1]
MKAFLGPARGLLGSVSGAAFTFVHDRYTARSGGSPATCAAAVIVSTPARTAPARSLPCRRFVARSPHLRL